MDRDTVTDMCVDLARCLDTLEQDLVILLRTATSTTCIHMSPLFNYYHYAWYSVLRICESPKSVRSIYAMHTNLPGFTLACHEGYSDASLLRVISLRR